MIKAQATKSTAARINGWLTSSSQWFRREVVARQFVRHVGVLTITNAVSAALTILQGVLVARWLGPELYGVAALVMSVPSLVYTFFDARSAEASIKYLSEFHARGERERAVAMCWIGYAIDMAVAALAFVGIATLAPWASRVVIHRPEVAGLVVLYGAAFLPRALGGTSYAVLASLGKFPTIALIDTLRTALQVTLVLVLVLTGWGVVGVIWGNAIAMALSGPLYGVPAIILLRRTWGRLPWTSTWPALKGHRREIARFLGYNNLNALLAMIPKQLDLVLLGYFRNPTEVGYYKLAKSIAGAVGNLVGPLQSVTYPDQVRRWGMGGWEIVRKRIRQLAFQVGVPFGVLVLMTAPLLAVLIPILVGRPYQPAMFATQILFVGSSVWVACFWLRPTYLALGEVRTWFRLSSTTLLILAPGMVVSARTWGFEGLAAWMAASQVWGHAAFAIVLFQRIRFLEKTVTRGPC